MIVREVTKKSINRGETSSHASIRREFGGDEKRG